MMNLNDVGIEFVLSEVGLSYYDYDYEDDEEEWEREGDGEEAEEEDEENIDMETGVSSVEVVNVESVSDGEDVDVVAVEEENGSGSSQQGGCGLDAENENDGGQVDRDEIDGLFCPICLEAWSSGGEHQVCCLPCGHIYGIKCIKKWLSRQGSNKCPQCKKNCRSRDIRLLYASQIVAIDGKLQKKVQFLEDKCGSLEKKNVLWSKKGAEWKRREAYLQKQLKFLKKRNRELEHLLAREHLSSPVPLPSSHRDNQAESSSGRDVKPKSFQRCSSNFKSQKDFHFDGARLFDFDASSHTFLVARRLLGRGGVHVLTKVSLLSEGETEDIQLPDSSKAVKDLQVSPHGKLVMLASLGRKLLILSTQSNNTILAYDLPAAAWSCAWDCCDSHYVYTGLQNGTVLQFDMRQTVGYTAALTGFACNPVHTLCSLPSSSSGYTTVVSASSAGLCGYEFTCSEPRPFVFPESGNYGVCISASCSVSGDYIVASYRPRIEASNPNVQRAQSTVGTHVVYRRSECLSYERLGETCGNVDVTRLPRSAIIEGVYENPVFASADESTDEIVFRGLPGFTVLDRIPPRKHPVRDIKFDSRLSSGTLGCLCDDFVHVFTI